jgi:hypothetical protein
MMKAAGLDLEVDKRQMFYPTAAGDMAPTDRFCLVRNSVDRVLTTNMGEHWNPVQNSQAFEFFNEFCMAGQMDMHTAGSLRNGKMVWALAKLSSEFELFNGDKDRKSTRLNSSHQHL